MSSSHLRDYQQRAVDAIEAQWRDHASTLVVLPTGGGKCLGRGTPVLMYDGSVKPVEDVRQWDVLMGPDSSMRLVHSVCRGRDMLYRVRPVKGDPYIVNEEHMLSLQMTGGRNYGGGGTIVDISVKDYLAQTKWFRHCSKGFRVGVTFAHRPVPLDPYYLGLWLGDGTCRNSDITTADAEVMSFLQRLAAKNGLRYVVKPQKNNASVVCALSGPTTGRSKIKKNPIRVALAHLRLLQNKHVPLLYKANDRETRLALLAGYIDADGSYHTGHYDCVSKSQTLANDIAYLARSLGLAAYVVPCKKKCVNNGMVGDYFRIGISGNLSDIPVLLPRKKAAKRRQNKDVLRTGISVEPVGHGEYFGFEITADGRFLLGDFTVTHNTVLFADVIRRRQPGRALVIAHREELIFQARDKIEKFAGLDCEIEMGQISASRDLFHKMPVVVATVQSLISGGKRPRMEKFLPTDFSTLVIDEFHHAVSASYCKVLDYFKLNPDLKILGVTATPDRADELALGRVCESVAYNYGMLDAINDGWLCPVEQQRVRIDGLDFSAVRTTAGDLNSADLAAVMENEKTLHGLCSATLNIIGQRQTIVFTAGVRHAEMAAEIFNRHKTGVADWVCGATDKEERRKIMARMHDATTQILVNVGVATEGFDCPGVEVIVMGRPTKSRSLHAQMAGRATRPLPGVVDGPPTAELRRAAIAASAKPACLLVDFVGNSGRHKLMTGADLLGGNYSDEVKALATDIMERDGGAWRLAQALELAEEEIREKQQKAEEERRLAEEARRAKLKAAAQYSATRIDPFDAYDIEPAPETGETGGRRLTEKQRSLLLKQGIDPDEMGYARAKQLLDEQFRRWDGGLCTLKQAALLNRYGYPGATMTRDAAKAAIDKIAANGWQRPADAPARTVAAVAAAAGGGDEGVPW